MTKSNQSLRSTKGFTLIELSIVLVIIGLIVGGVLVGQDLIKAAEIRATVSQVEKYNTAVNTFRLKYNGMPGDIANPTQFFASVTNGNESAQGDGDGLIEATSAANTVCTTTLCVSAEGAVFWYMLNQAGLIPEAITTTNYETVTLTPSDSTNPPAKMGKGARFAVMNIGGTNYFTLANLGTAALAAGTGTFTNAMTPTEAFQFDTKMDDGKPATGTVLSIATATALPGTAANGATAAAMTATACYDTTGGNYATTTMNSNNNANAQNCSLSVRTNF